MAQFSRDPFPHSVIAIFQGPFSTFKYPIETGCDWTGIKFSLDGKMMMLTTNGAVIRYRLSPLVSQILSFFSSRVIDAYEGKPMFTLAGYQNNKVWILVVHILYQYGFVQKSLSVIFQGLPIEASFTPDSQFVVSGSTDGLLHLWRTEDGRSAGVLTGEHQVMLTAGQKKGSR